MVWPRGPGVAKISRPIHRLVVITGVGVTVASFLLYAEISHKRNYTDGDKKLITTDNSSLIADGICLNEAAVIRLNS